MIGVEKPLALAIRDIQCLYIPPPEERKKKYVKTHLKVIHICDSCLQEGEDVHVLGEETPNAFYHLLHEEPYVLIVAYTALEHVDEAQGLRHRNPVAKPQTWLEEDLGGFQRPFRSDWLFHLQTL